MSAHNDSYTCEYMFYKKSNLSDAFGNVNLYKNRDGPYLNYIRRQISLLWFLVYAVYHRKKLNQIIFVLYT